MAVTQTKGVWFPRHSGYSHLQLISFRRKGEWMHKEKMSSEPFCTKLLEVGCLDAQGWTPKCWKRLLLRRANVLGNRKSVDFLGFIKTVLLATTHRSVYKWLSNTFWLFPLSFSMQSWDRSYLLHLSFMNLLQWFHQTQSLWKVNEKVLGKIHQGAECIRWSHQFCFLALPDCKVMCL